jgi:regulator of RNase E activity RraA
MKTPLTAGQLEALRQIDSCTLANAIETFQIRLRNDGFSAGATRCLFPHLRPMVGYAVTVKIHGASPPTGSRTYLEHTDWWDYLRSVPWPRVAVIEDASSQPGLGAMLGEVHLNIMKALGCVGAVTNGAVRDIPAVADLGFQIFAGQLSVSHSYTHIVEFGRPVKVDGLEIHSGDLLHGDLHGFQTVPIKIAGELPAVAARIAARDHALVALCREPGFSVEKLRAAVSDQKA